MFAIITPASIPTETSIGKWTPKYNLLYANTNGNMSIKYMYLYFSFSKRVTNTAKNVDVVA